LSRSARCGTCALRRRRPFAANGGACRAGRAQLAVCLKGIPIEAVEAIARLGSSMPHKSTYFYPKIATGMVLKPLV